MKNNIFQIHLSKPLLFSGVFALAMSSAYADSACDAEVVTLQAAIDAPAAEVSDADLEQAIILFDMLSANCASGSTLDDEAPISQQIRALLGMGET